jgi:hypothetical protein
MSRKRDEEHHHERNVRPRHVAEEAIRLIDERCLNLLERIAECDEREAACQEQLTNVEREITRTTHLASQLRISGQNMLRITAELRETHEEALAIGHQRRTAQFQTSQTTTSSIPVVEEELNLEALRALNCKQCPNCGVRTQKNGGCDHMVSLFIFNLSLPLKQVE